MKIILPVVVTLLIGGIVGEVVWGSSISGVLYRCTDSAGFDFITPGNWYHPGTDDWIRPGWSHAKLWQIWSAMTASIVALACLAGWLGNRSGRRQA